MCEKLYKAKLQIMIKYPIVKFITLILSNFDYFQVS